MRIIFEIARLFAVVAVFGLMAANSGCAKPEGGSGGSGPSTELGDPEAGSTTGGGAEVPEGEEPEEGEGEEPAEGEGEAPAEGEGEAAAEAKESEAPAEAEAEGEAPAEEAKTE